MRIRTTSLRGRMLIAVLLALLLAQGIAMWIAMGARQEAVRSARTGDALDRIAALVFVLERTPPDLHANLLRAVETPLVVLTLDDAPSLAEPSPRLSRLARRLGAELGDDMARDIRVAVIDTGTGARNTSDRNDSDSGRSTSPAGNQAARGEMHAHPGHHGEAGSRQSHRPVSPRDSRKLAISLALQPEGWLNAEIRFPWPDRTLPATSFASFVLSAAAVAVALWLVLSRLVGPLRGLAGAAERLGRGEEVGMLPLTGPSEMRALTDAFNRMQERLHRMVSDRTQMLAALGHDLRSPLTALRIQTEMVDDDETRERLLASLAEMQEMVEQTLTYARGVWTAEPVETVDVTGFLSELAGDYDPLLALDAPDKAVLLRLRPATIRRALRNLIDNARRYGGEVGLALHVQPDVVRIEVSDRGPGIPEDQLAQVFDPFIRGEASRSRETGGTGLGLSIARSIAQAHGGDVSLANREGGGLVATLTLPRPPEG